MVSVRDIEKWTESERDKVLRPRSEGLYDDFSENIRDASISDVGDDTLLDRAIDQVSENYDGESAIGMSLMSAIREVEEIGDAAEEIESKAQTLYELGDEAPDFIEDKKALEESSDEIKSRNSTNKIEEDFEDQSDGLLNKILSDVEMERFKQQNNKKPAFQRSRTITNVREIRENVFEYNYNSESNLDIITSSDFIEIVDSETGETIQDISGFDDSSVDDEGRIILKLPDGSEKKLIPREKKQPRKSPSLNKDGKKDQAIRNITEAKDEIRYEAWACSMLNLTTFIYDRWIDIDNRLDGLRDILSTPNDLLNDNYSSSRVFGDIGQMVFNVKSNLKDIRERNIPGFSDLKVSNRISQRSQRNRPGNQSLCDQNKEKYCNISKHAKKIDDKIDSARDFVTDRDRIPETIEDRIEDWEALKSEVADFLDDFDEKVNEIKDKKEEAERLATSLKPRMCSIISDKKRGMPGGIDEVIEAAHAIYHISRSLPPNPLQGSIDKWDGWKDWPDSLRDAGYDKKADELEKGDIESFVDKESPRTTQEEAVEDIREMESQEENPALRQRLRKLRRTTEGFHDQSVVPQKVREKTRLKIFHRRSVDFGELLKDELSQ